MNNEIKSQDDLNRQGRESDVLIATIMKCQELVKEKVELEYEIKELKKKIHILTESQMKLENTIGELGKENSRLKERDEIFSVLIENLHGLQQEKWYDLVKTGTREQRIDFLRNTENHTLFGAIDKNLQLKKLLKECHNQLSKLLVDGAEPQEGEIVKFLTKIEEALK